MKTLFLSALMIMFCSCASMDGKRVVVKPSNLNTHPGFMPTNFHVDRKDGGRNSGIQLFSVEVERTFPEFRDIELADRN